MSPTPAVREPVTAEHRRTLHPWRRRALRLLPVVVALAVAVPLLVGRRGELNGAGYALAHLRSPWVVAAVAAELGSLWSYVALQRRLLLAGGVPMPATPMAGITLAGNAIQNSLPAGPAWSAVFAFRQLRLLGVDSVLAGWTMVAVSIVSDACLVTVALVGLAVAGSQGSSSGLTSLVVVVAGLAGGLLVAGWLAVRSRGAVPVAVTAVRLCQRVSKRPAGDAREVVATARARLSAVRPGRPDWTAAAGWGLANWLFDCGALALAFLAVRASVPWRGLLFAYTVAQLAANLPITPGGLGVVEGSLSIALVVYGGSGQSTVAAVLLYRIISFWALLPLGWLSWLALRWRARHRPVPAGEGA